MARPDRPSRTAPEDARLPDLGLQADIDDSGVQRLLARGLSAEEPYLR